MQFLSEKFIAQAWERSFCNTFVIQSKNIFYNGTCGVLYIHEGWLRCVQGTKNENTKIKYIYINSLLLHLLHWKQGGKGG